MAALYRHIWTDFFKSPLDEMPPHENAVRAALKEIVLRGQWYEVYDLLEFALNSPQHTKRNELAAEVSRILSEENAGFRLMDGQFVQITDETEIAAIEEGLSATSRDRFAPARVHLVAALGFLSDRHAPDYRNSIKEAISAVEAIAQIVTANPQATLGQALKVATGRVRIHGALLSAFSSLYGYTNDADGIRHALSDEPNLDAADAKFMLVVCSAFVVYLIQKAGASGTS
jgi:hypothetical protein